MREKFKKEKNMKLSEAIRLGAMLKPQAFNELVENWPIGQTVMGQFIETEVQARTCALGAACDAVGQLYNDRECDDIFPQLKQVSVCPEGCSDFHVASNLFDVIPHLNDTHQWTRERIAAWVATVEPREQEEYNAPSLVPDHASASQHSS